jgi:hypothetical protein
MMPAPRVVAGSGDPGLSCVAGIGDPGSDNAWRCSGGCVSREV